MSDKNKLGQIKDKLAEWNHEIGEYLNDIKSNIYDFLKGEALERGSGKVSDQEAKTMGHIEAHGIIALETLDLGENGLNETCSMGPELIPVTKKTKRGIIKAFDSAIADEYNLSDEERSTYWIIDEEEAEKIATKENLNLKCINGEYFFEYEGYRIEDRILKDFVANFYRATGSRNGETKSLTMTALGAIQSPPMFPQMAVNRPMGQQYGFNQDGRDPDSGK